MNTRASLKGNHLGARGRHGEVDLRSSIAIEHFGLSYPALRLGHAH
jgi:hypothetical protein